MLRAGQTHMSSFIEIALNVFNGFEATRVAPLTIGNIKPLRIVIIAESDLVWDE